MNKERLYEAMSDQTKMKQKNRRNLVDLRFRLFLLSNRKSAYLLFLELELLLALDALLELLELELLLALFALFALLELEAFDAL